MGNATQMESGERTRASDAVILSVMALAAVAAGTAGYVQLGLSSWLAIALSIAVFAALAGLHRKGGRKIGGASRTDVDQLEAEIAKLNTLTRQAGTKAAAAFPPPSLPRQASHPAARRIPVAKAAAPGLPEEADRQRPSLPPAPPRPPAAREGTLAQPPLAAAAPDAGRLTPQSPREADVEMVQGLVRKLADQVTAAESATADSAPARAKPRMDGAIEASLEALRATASTMRAASEPAPPAAGARPAVPVPRDATPPPLANAPVRPAPSHRDGASADQRAALIAEALSAGRAEVLLEPILNLDDRRVRHYGAALRLKSATGEPIECQPSRDPRHVTFGPALDGLRLARTAQLARKLAERGKSGFIFFEVGAAALDSGRFLAEFAALCHEPAAWVRQLAPAFTQADVAAFTSREWDALRDLGKSGICFSMQRLENLDMNFAVVKTWGFEFVEIDAARFLAGLPHAGKAIAPADAARQIAAAGLTPVIRGIDEDAKLAPLVASGAVLGLGPLFGAPRPVKADALRNAA